MINGYLRTSRQPAWRLGLLAAVVTMLACLVGPPPTVRGQTVLAHKAFLPLVARERLLISEMPFGVQIYDSNATVVSRIDQMGARWIRIPLSWATIEPANTTPENYFWPVAFDQKLADLASANVQIILTLGGNPAWAATYRSGPVDKVEIGELVEFMEAAVAHFGQPPYNVKYWELYNEPDNGSEFYAERGWGYFGHTPDLYAATLAAVYGPMKAVDPAAQVLLGGMAYDWWEADGGPFVEAFLDGVLLSGGGAYFDALNFHYYPVFHSHWDPYGMGIAGKTAYLRNKMAEYGVQKPIVCTEAGMWSDPEHGGSDELQSRYVPQVYARSRAAGLQTTIWFMLVDEPALGVTKYGLLNADLSPKPGYSAYRTVAWQLAGAEYLGTLAVGEIEAYEFRAADASKRVVMAWTNDEMEHTMVLRASEVLVADKYGEEVTIRDEDDGRADGRVVVTVGPSPVYLRYTG